MHCPNILKVVRDTFVDENSDKEGYFRVREKDIVLLEQANMYKIEK